MNQRLLRKRREDCWTAAKLMTGRDPARWRLDVRGNPVLKFLRDCSGPLCHSFELAKDHCVLHQACLYKTSHQHSPERCSLPVVMSDLELDMVERGVYGNVKN